MDITISLIIPIYNVEPYIEDCLQSVINQNYNGKVECILVDDCGTDKSMYIAEHVIDSYTGPIQFKISRHNENRGLSAARNTGIIAAQGDYIFFLDSDDEITPNCLDVFSEIVSENQYDLIVGGLEIKGSSKKIPDLFLPTGTILYNEDILSAYHQGLWYMMAQNKLYSRKFIEKNKLQFKEGIIHEDNLWSFEVACHAHSAYFTKQITYLYKIRDNSIITNLDSVKSIESLKIILYEMVNYSNKNGLQNSRLVHNHIQGFLSLLMARCFYVYSYEYAKRIYLQIRNSQLFSWKQCIKLNKYNLKKNIRDVHYLFTPTIGFYIEALLVCSKKYLR